MKSIIFIFATLTIICADPIKINSGVTDDTAVVNSPLQLIPINVAAEDTVESEVQRPKRFLLAKKLALAKVGLLGLG